MNEEVCKELFDITNLRELMEFASSHSILNHPYTISHMLTLQQLCCKFCDKKFSEKEKRKIHERICKQNPNHETFKCKTCDSQFKSRQELSAHTCSLHTCIHCTKGFASEQNLQAHTKRCRSRPRCADCMKYFSTQEGLSSHNCALQCKTCKLKFPSRQDLDQHNISCRIICSTCQKQFSSIKALNLHHCGDNATPSKGVKCSRCGFTCIDRRALALHIRDVHLQRGRGADQFPTPNFTDPELESCYTAHRSYIFDDHVIDQPLSFYNFPLNDETFTLDSLCNYADFIYQDQPNTFKLNLSFGMILQNIETEEYRYFRAYSNDPLFHSPIHISEKEDLNKLREKLSELDITQYILKARPNTKWQPVLVTNVRFYATSTGFTLGSAVNLPEYITNSRSLISLQSNFYGKFPYEDNYCLFRCIALCLGGKELYQKEETFHHHTLHYFQQFSRYMQQDFSSGVSLEYMHDVEKCFQISINVFSLEEDGSSKIIYKSQSRFANVLNMNMYGNHLSFITNTESYCKKYRCINCDQLFKTASSCKRHQTTCSLASKYQFPGGFYQLRDSIFHQLEEYGICVPDEDRYFEYFGVFDFESYLKRINCEESAEKTRLTQEHCPISVSVCSNVPGYEKPHCIVNPNAEQLIKSMMEYLGEIQLKSREIVQAKFQYVIDRLDEWLLHWEEQTSEETRLFVDIMKRKIEALIATFETYTSQLPVLGFNSSKYDLCLIRPYIARQMQLDEDEGAYTIKRNSAYSCIANENFKFLDLSNYLAPGTSYASFLKAFDIAEAKGYFPYSYLDDPAKLDDTHLPSYESFYSDLTETNVLGTLENYALVQKIWDDNNMQTFKEYLIYYNNLDTEPMVQGVIKMLEFYKSMQIDVFKTTISLPGIARQLLHNYARDENAWFPLIDAKNKDLFFTIQNNLVGGPSIIFNREAIAGITKIRGSDKTVQTISGYDANSLYLYCFSFDFPTGSYTRRRAEDNFKPVLCDKFQDMYDYMDFFAEQNGVTVLHNKSQAHETRVGRYLCDGIATMKNEKTGEMEQVIIQYDSCFLHGHENCEYNTSEPNSPEDRAKRQRTAHRDAYCRKLGYRVHRIRECEYKKLKKENVELREFLNKRKPKFYKSYKQTLTQDEILDGVKSGNLFGFVEVDVSVPETWEGDFKQDISPYDYFSEMSPIFCTTEVKFEDIGAHMQNYIKTFGLSQKPRKLLVGGMKAEKILLATPLLRWYLLHGLKVSKIYQTIEFTPNPCFKKFVKDMADGRRAGDISESKKLFADLHKLISNASYGSLSLNKLKHSEIKYVASERDACMEANSNRFKNMARLHPDYDFFEIEKHKRRVVLDSANYLAFYILQIAKLRMLEFYYDFLLHYIDRSDILPLYTDTDSQYLAFSARKLEDVIKPRLKSEFEEAIYNMCDDRYNEVGPTSRFLPRKCCPKHEIYDKRQPGLFKIEFQNGEEFIGLASKTYIVKAPSETKFSSKGLSKRRISEPYEKFRKVLDTRTSTNSTNKGFISKNSSVFTYEQMRNGFTYLYVKREVCDDGVSTKPLQTVLKPYNKYNQLCEL